jgi:hypothetical protein
MQFEELKRLLVRQAELIVELVRDVTPEQARWKPDDDRWSVLEVVNHLYDEEQYDFRVRLDIILHTPDAPWPPIRPMEWVTERRYNERDLEASLENFLAERRASLAWLDGLDAPDWDTGVQSPWDFIIRAGDMFTSWVVHDQWHIEQLVRLRRAYTIAQVAPYSVEYAGTL